VESFFYIVSMRYI